MLGHPADRARAAFLSRFGAEATCVGIAPGRVELLGNHTDYNNGLVLAAAIDRLTAVAGRPAGGREAWLYSEPFDDLYGFPIDAPGPEPTGSWGRYVRGVCLAMADRLGPIRSGFEAAVAGDVPLEAGLSSSASLEAAVALFLLGAGLLGQEQEEAAVEVDDRMALAHTLRKAENQYVGVASGLLDQFCALFGKTDHALMLDCASFTFERLPLGEPAPAIVVCDSRTSRKLADGMYNRRREECDRIVSYFREHPPASSRSDPYRPPPPVESLRDVTLEDLNAYRERLDPVGFRRARHVLTENDRVRQGVEALRRGDVVELGRLMSASHASSRDDFENSSKALDVLIESAEAAPGFLGGKLSGAGWAGCTVNLVRADRAEEFAAAVVRDYSRRTGAEARAYVCRAADGASCIRGAEAPGASSTVRSCGRDGS
ncbi:galactokinase [Tautonia sociabilis]|uniref:Galactokinase n=1 Tax=Tautonia sociabilis TaxID=2080755 RepID=A0A432MP97_9BACT|nr:galactokinase [Tautonia sociabilis]RUL88997.1 galactokinase [Tautonia sociabilis]